MQGVAISYSPSISVSKKLLKFQSSSLSRFNLSPSKRISSVNGSSSSSPFICSARQIGWVSGPNRGHSGPVSVRAVSVQESPGAVPSPKSSSVKDTLVLGTLFGLWYLFNIYFNIYDKQVLEVFPYPLTITSIQLAIGTLLVMFMWIFNLYKLPKINRNQLATILPLAVMHTLGHLFTNMSLGKVSVSFTHTIKATEPFFSVVLSAMFLREFPTMWVVSSLVPIVGGVAFASLTEVSFNWAGFWSAMASNLTNQSRNVLSKKFMANTEESLDDITLFSVMTIMSFVLIAPVAFFIEGVKFAPSVLLSSGLNLKEIYVWSLYSALCYHAYQQIAYMILQRVSPVTHSVGNCVKRVVVIVSSVLFFRTPVLPINALGTAVALTGVFLYSRATRIKSKSA